MKFRPYPRIIKKIEKIASRCVECNMMGVENNDRLEYRFNTSNKLRNEH